jgi:hypothetical protein
MLDLILGRDCNCAVQFATFGVPDNHSSVFFAGRAPETACQHTKSGHHCPPDENNTLRSQLPTQNDLPVKLSIFYGYKPQTLFNDQPRSIKCATG